MQNDSVSVVKTHASILIESLKEQGITIKKTQALEIMSKLENRTDWNRLRARLKNLDEPKPKAPAKKKSFDCVVLLAPAKHQKTETLKALFELEYKDKVTMPVMICMSGDGHTFGNGSDHIIHGHERISVTYDEFGISGDPILRPSRYAEPHGLIINMVSKTKGNRVGAGLAVAQFLKAYDEELHKFRIDEKNVGTLMVDGFEQIVQQETDEVAKQINIFCQQKTETIRRVVISSREMLSSDNVLNLGMNLINLCIDLDSYPCKKNQKFKELESVFPINIYSWKSDSILNLSIVEDMYWLMRHRASSSFDGPIPGESRISNIPGRSSWFMDFKSSLIS
jgi:hypothetical protein